MTFNHIELLNNSYTNTGSNKTIYDGQEVSVLHDGLYRYLYIKNQKTTIRLPEPYTQPNQTGFIIGNNSNNLYFLNPTTRKVRSIAINGQTLNPAIYIPNDYNYLRDYSYVGSSAVNNMFIPTCGSVNNTTIVLGGYLNSPSAGLTVDGKVIPNESICYMYSEDSGSTFNGPIFPFINTANSLVYTGRVLNTKLINDNWVFYINTGSTSYLNFVQTLGVDFIGNNVGLGLSSTNQTNYQCPYVYFDSKLYFELLDRNGYGVYDYLTDTISTVNTSTITNMLVISNSLYITFNNNCNPTIIPAVNATGQNTITSFTLNNINYNLTIDVGSTYITESTENELAEQFTNSNSTPLDSSHTLQPANLTPAV